MNETLRLLYDKFYTPLPMVESEQEVENCHRQLIERLDKPERKLVLRIIDAQNLMIEQRSVDSFICFRYFRPKLVVPKYASKLATGSTTQSESSGLLAR